jgi:REP element-mobilizing transposase RayT
MQDNFTKIYLHCIWTTWDRLPLLKDELEEQVLAAIVAKCAELGCRVIALNAALDHVHLLVEVPSKLSVSDLMKHVKGASSHRASHVIGRAGVFRWSSAYAVFSVSAGDVDRVADYIRRQKEHHAQKFLFAEWEPFERRAQSSESHCE